MNQAPKQWNSWRDVYGNNGQKLQSIKYMTQKQTNLNMNQKDIENIFRDYYKELYTQPWASGQSDIKTFLNFLDLPSKCTKKKNT